MNIYIALHVRSVNEVVSTVFQVRQEALNHVATQMTSIIDTIITYRGEEHLKELSKVRTLLSDGNIDNAITVWNDRLYVKQLPGSFFIHKFQVQ